jgi:inosine/xanthosine triphosphate pyrophosphatase family protein
VSDGPSEDPFEQWLDNMAAHYRETMEDPQVTGDDDTGYLVSAVGTSPGDMATQFQQAMGGDQVDGIDKLALLLAYAVRRVALQQMDIEHKRRNP